MNVKQGEMTGAPITPVPAVLTTGQPKATVMATDLPASADRLGRVPVARLLAEVVAHGLAETPFCLGIFGPAGSGKSTFLNSVIESVERLEQAAETAGLATVFQSKIAVVRVWGEPGAAPSGSLTRQVSAALASRYPHVIAETADAGLDPRAAAREADERLNEARQRLDAERRNLDALSGRQAALTDTVLFEMAGSRIDSYARSIRGRIERAVRGFGIGGDPVIAYKSAVREASEAGGPVARWTGWLHAFWAYRGQGRLLVLAIACLLAAWGVGALIANEPKLVEAVRSGGEKLTSVADWVEREWHWLHPLKRALELAALASLALNLARGLRFLLPIHRGVVLLRSDLDARRRDLDGLLAHQTLRVERIGTRSRSGGPASRRCRAATLFHGCYGRAAGPLFGRRGIGQ